MKKIPRASLPLILTFLLLAGCSAVISKSALKDVVRGIKFADIKKDPSGLKGRSVLLGGRVIGVENLKDTSLIEVLQFPLSRNMKPKTGKKSEGRFLIRNKGFIDPLVYKGRLITVTGPLAGAITRPLNKTNYTYPVIESEEFYLWRFEEKRGSPISIGIGFGLSGGY